MGRLAGEITALTNFSLPFATEREGRVFNIGDGLVAQQQVAGSATLLESGGTLSVAAGTVVSSPFAPASSSPSGMNSMVFNSSNTRLTFDNPEVGRSLCFAAKELTLSMWVSGSTYVANAMSLSSSCRIIVSGNAGIQFTLGAVDPGPPSNGLHSVYAVAVMSGNLPVSDRAINIIASTLTLAGTPASRIEQTGFNGRYFEVREIKDDRLFDPVNVNNPAWNHIVYVQRAAQEPEALVPSSQFGASISQRERSSRSGKEGRCEMWLNGRLVYTSPAAGPFPESFSPYFYEDGLDGLNGSADSPYRNNYLQKKTIRQPNVVCSISGSSGNGDSIAQLAIWQKCLSSDEIVAIYEGTRNGVYTTQKTSFSSAPKKLIDADVKISQPARNQGFPDSTIGLQRRPFTDRSYYDKDFQKKGVYQGDMWYDQPQTLSNHFDSISGAVFESGLSTREQQTVGFFERDNLTTDVEDIENVIPSGSSQIVIQVPTVDSAAVAARYQKTRIATARSALGLDGRSQIIGTGFLYYSPYRKMWVEKRPDASTSQTSVMDFTDEPMSASNYLEQSSESVDALALQNNPLFLTNRVMCQFAWSPQFGYFVNHVEHLKQTGYERIGWPTGMFSAPNAPRYHGYDSETFKMRDFIDRPFLLKRIELRISVEARRRFGNNPAGAASTNSWDEEIYNKKDIDNYVFFVYRQRRLSKNKDSFDDRTTSKRYLIASASLCYYNSGSFGGAWSDGYYTDPSSNWQDPANVAISNGIAKPDDAVDFFGQSLTKISSSNAILHNPQYVKDWGQQRTIGTTSTLYDRQNLTLKMLPAVVPPCSVAPSLMPVTRSSPFGVTLASERFARREGGTGSVSLQNCYYYMTSGTRASPSLNRPAPFLTLASHQWFGGTRPPTVVSFSNGYYYGFSVNIPDSYDAIFSPAELAGRGAVAIPGQVDAIAVIAPAYVSSSYSEILNLDIDSRTRFVPIRGPTQSHGISMLPAFFVSGSSEQLGVKVRDLKYQQPIDPQAVNSPIPAGNTSTTRFYGRKSFNSADPNDWTVEHGNRYMGYYGWRFISSFQVGDMTERQIYSPMLLEPEDELILGLDAGTFGPPDLSQDDLVADGLGPTTGSGHGVGYEPAGVKKSYKDTFLKEDYSAVMVGSSLRIQTGDAQLVLIGEFLQNGQPVIQSRDIPISSNVSTFYGEEEIYDVNLLYNADLMSGSMLTRIFSGSEGPDGLIRGNTNPSLARRFFYDAGARKSY